MINRRVVGVVALLLSVFLLYIFVVAAKSYVSSVDVDVLVENSKEVSIQLSGNTIARSGGTKPMRVRVPMNTNIEVLYVGSGDYESSKRTVSVETTSQNIRIKPYFSDRKLSTMLQEQQPKITSAIVAYNPEVVGRYSIQEVTLHHYGEWASARLRWAGDLYNENNDSLWVVLQRKNNNWAVMGKPNIVLFKDTYSSVPEDILHKINIKD